MLWSRIAAFATASRAALACIAALVAMLVLVLAAELPLYGALQAALAVERQGAQNQPQNGPPACAEHGLATAVAPLESFDGRLTGYSASEGRRILCAMTLEGGAGRAAYLGRHFPLDMAFPAIYGPALALILAFFIAETGRRGWLWRALALAPIAAGLADWAENLAVRALVVAGPTAQADAIETASALTRLKFGLLVLGLAPILALLAVSLWRRARG